MTIIEINRITLHYLTLQGVKCSVLRIPPDGGGGAAHQTYTGKADASRGC